jgi:subtilisin-like proprotein convertase family protein
VREIEVAIDITHSYIGDLLVELISPANTTVVLHNRAGGNADNIIKTYNKTTTPDLNVLRGKSIQGRWQLRASDHEAQDVGKLGRWALKIWREP